MMALACVGINTQAQSKGKSKSTAKTVKTADGFTVLPSGLEYKFIKDAPGKPGKVGNQITMYFKSSVGDSVMFDSKKMIKDEFVSFTLQNPRFNSDVNEGLLLMSKGDIAVFRTPLDSIVKAGDRLLPWMDPKGKMVYNVEALDLKTPEQVDKENAEKEAAQIAKDEKDLNDYFKAHNVTPTKTATGLYYLITEAGTGEKPQVGQQVTVNYTGKTLNGKVFDSNMDSAFHHVQPFTFPLGHNRVIKGWDEGIALLKKGEKATLYIPSRYAYGVQSPTPDIPANSVLIFDVELVDIAGDATPAPVPHTHSHDEGEGHQH